jgi:hypothetical protein
MKFPKYPQGVEIREIRQVKRGTQMVTYAILVDKENNLLISATLDYIVAQLKNLGIESSDSEQ